MSHNVYFAAAIRGGGEDTPIHSEFVDHMVGKGVHVFSEHLDPDSNVVDGRLLSSREIHDRDMEWIERSSAVVAEVTQTSHGVGYELGRIADMYKPGLALYAKDDSELSAMIDGAPHILPLRYERTRKGMIIAKAAIDVFLHDVFYGTPRLNDKKTDFYKDVVKEMN
jgi:2'-deoxynucleoside 5'-phosphate N-hydrolase